MSGHSVDPGPLPNPGVTELAGPPSGGVDSVEAEQSRDDGRTRTEPANPAAAGESPTAAGDGQPSPIVPVTCIADLEPGEPADWIWPGYVARGCITLLTGVWKGGKTTLITDLLRDLSTGRGLVDKRIHGKVLIISEESRRAWSTRRDNPGLPDNIYLLKRESFAHFTDAEWKELISGIASDVKTQNYELVIIDTLANHWPVEDENSAVETSRALSPLRAIAEAGAAVLVVHHPAKGSDSEADNARGSGAITAFPDILVTLGYLSGEGRASTRRRLVAKGRLEDIPAEVTLERTPDGYVVLGSVGSASPGDTNDEIATLLVSAGNGLTVDEIKEGLTNAGHSCGKARLSRLLREGSERGQWKSTGAGHKGDPIRYVRASESAGGDRRPETFDSDQPRPPGGEANGTSPAIPGELPDKHERQSGELWVRSRHGEPRQ